MPSGWHRGVNGRGMPEFAQGRQQFGRISKALGGILSEHSRHDGLQGGRNFAIQTLELLWFLTHDAVRSFDKSRGPEGMLAGKHLVEHDAERKDVGAAVE